MVVVCVQSVGVFKVLEVPTNIKAKNSLVNVLKRSSQNGCLFPHLEEPDLALHGLEKQKIDDFWDIHTCIQNIYRHGNVGSESTFEN